MKISRKRKQELMCTALSYAGALVSAVVDSYEAFNELPEHERKFVDEYIVSIGDRLIAQAEQRREANKVAAYKLLRKLEGKRGL
jgi:dsRNA-specific ribonuclease